MSLLREEYKKNQEKKKSQLDEAAFEWVKSNVIVIHERMNRRAVQKLIDQITKFEERFGAYKDRLPSIAGTLDNAEQGLILVLTGKTSDKRASEMLQQMSFVYNNLSSFFSKDLPILLNTPIFKTASENPEIRLDSLTLPGFNPDTIKRSFVTAIQPTREEEKLLRKVLKTSKVPHIEAANIADELLSLNYNDLKELTNIERVPIAVPAATPQQPVQQEQIVANPGQEQQPLVPALQSESKLKKA